MGSWYDKLSAPSYAGIKMMGALCQKEFSNLDKQLSKPAIFNAKKYRHFTLVLLCFFFIRVFFG